MPKNSALSVDDVRLAALEGRVARHPRCHIERHGFTLRDVRRMLARAQRVARDARPQHPRGWLAWARDERGRAYRVDFEPDDGPPVVVLVVTAMELEPA